MIGNNPTFTKLLMAFPRRIELVDDFAIVIPEDMRFTPEELESLRRDDAAWVESTGNHIIANFMPDEIRPADVPKM